MHLRLVQCGLLALCAGAAYAQAPSRILVDQVGRAQAGTAEVAQPRLTRVRGAQAVAAPARPGASTSQDDGVSPLAETCAQAAPGAEPTPECAALARQQAQAAAQKSTPEGTLLYLFGQQDSPTRATTTVSRDGGDADAVARELGSEAAGVPESGDAAAIASRQRPTPTPQAGPPR